MRRVISLFIALVFTAALVSGCGKPSDKADMGKISAEVVDSNNQFAFDIFRELNSEEGKKSVFISPLSISTALSMVYEGSGSTTKEAMENALKYKGMGIETINSSYKNLLLHLNSADSKVSLNIKNSIWIRQGEVIKEEFLNTNKDVFNAYISQLDFSKSDAAATINNWIKEATNGKIDKMVNSPIDPYVIMYLINAIYFKGDWTTRFDEKNTFETEFTNENGNKEKTMMMNRRGEAEYGSGEGYKAVKLPYGNKTIAMYCILPENGTTVDELIKTIDSSKWKKITEGLSLTQDLVLQIPRFKLEYGKKELKDTLTALGMGECFTENADLSGIRDNIFISSVLHKAVIEVNEKGTEAAAATVVEIKETMAGDQITFIADRPFVFLISDTETGSVLFMGKYSGAM
ncbi:MAG: serpin family protein [Clostridiaceae bacterium]